MPPASSRAPRIAVTGVGVVAPTGSTEAALWAALRGGRSAVAPGEDGYRRAPDR